MSAPLHTWLPEHQVQLRYARTSTASPDDLWAAANDVRLSDTRTMRRLIRWRLGRHAPDGDETYKEFFRSGIFTLLEEGERLSVSGVAGRIWAPSGDYARFESSAEYREWSQRGTAKVVVCTAVHDHERGSEIVSESGVQILGGRARILFRGSWTVLAPFGRYIGSEVLAAAVRRAEAG